ncbi:NAD(P)/FAD-dependent oxidoreductase [Allosaccharopolyspora coralli]|uniref:NAD(P)/FAD-dependent oxidoreductase n=1 Tax=Allosaccharopolyspora coralli TaxID=2665642 RepID=A0A5Q3Q8N5_9PSEU|nr:NAD(P)/FAD-dependent oxidoreductase [Allosaccharopolyspora coralli]QGK70842.1 NAD(P)/FAD-dependent oxidoreductase [Allosaccharopolyspora coralli]
MRSFDVVILGGGAGAKMIWGSVPGGSVAVIESGLVGGHCPFFACVPSKAMLQTAATWRLAAHGQFTDLFTGGVSARQAYDQAVRRRDRLVHDRDDSAGAAALAETGATLVRGHGRIARPGVVTVDGEEIGYRDLVLNTGSTPTVPDDIPGLDDIAAWTSEHAMSTAEYPDSLVIVGGGPVGCEMAYLFAAFGCTVTLVQRASRLIPREEPEASQQMADTLEGLGVQVALSTTASEVQTQEGRTRVLLDTEYSVAADTLLFATGRTPATTDIGLDTLGVVPDERGFLPTDEHCRVTGTDNVWAIGDAAGPAPFTHTAHYQGRVVAANLAGRPVRTDYRALPRTVYTDPTFASVGHTEASARQAGTEPVIATAAVSDTVRATIDGTTQGWLKLIADPHTGTLLGATATGGRAEEWISELSQALRSEIPITDTTDVIHPFPTFSEELEGALWKLAPRF